MAFIYSSRYNSMQQKQKEDRSVQGEDLGRQQQNLKVDGNHIYIYNDIDDKTMLYLKTQVQKFISSYRQTQIMYPMIKEQQLEIHIHIASCGGDLFSGFGMYDLIKKCPYTIHTYIEGFSASAATFPFLAGKYRHMSQNSFILIHQYSTMIWGTYKNIKDELQSGTKFMNKMKKIYLSNSNLTEQKLDLLLSSDLWLTYQQAKEIGFVNI